MKPNLVIVQPPHVRMDSVIEQFCEEYCESHYVYLIRPDSGCRDDSPAGVRFLSHPLDQLPGFGRVDIAISLGGGEVTERLKASYPCSKLATWDPFASSEIPDSVLALLRPTIVRGDFGEMDNRNLARAI